MSPLVIGTTTCEITEVAAFEFHPPAAEAGGPHGKFPSLRADFFNGTSIITRGNKAVTLKVLLASLGVREINAPTAKETFTPRMEKPSGLSANVSH